jgi:hypothetical protein
MSTVVRFPERGRWAWDARGDSRAVRVSPHPRENVVNLSVWRDDVCVGTVRLLPAEAATLVAGLTDGLARLAARPVEASTQVQDLEARLGRIESRLAAPTWRTAAAALARRASASLGFARPAGVRTRPTGGLQSG